MIVITVFSVFPLENLLIHFQTPEKVFNYTNTGNINDIVYGKDSCMLIYENKGGMFNYCIIPKSEKGHKIPNYFMTKRIFHKFDQDGNFSVYHILGTNDYYLMGIAHSKDNQINISGNDNATIKNIIYEPPGNTKTVFLYSYIENYSKDFYLLFNGKKITLSQ